MNTLVWNKIKQEMKPQTQTTTSLYLKSSDVVQQLYQVCQSEPNLEWKQNQTFLFLFWRHVQSDLTQIHLMQSADVND